MVLGRIPISSEPADARKLIWQQKRNRTRVDLDSSAELELKYIW